MKQVFWLSNDFMEAMSFEEAFATLAWEPMSGCHTYNARDTLSISYLEKALDTPPTYGQYTYHSNVPQP